MDNDFHGLLIRLAESMSEKDFKNLKFLSSKYISASRLENVTDFLDLFDELKSRRIIGEDKVGELKILVERATNGKTSVLDLIKDYEENNKSRGRGGSSSSTIDSNNAAAAVMMYLKKECAFLTNNLGKDWKFFVRALNVPDPEIDYFVDQSPRQVKETIHACLKYWITDVLPPNQTGEESKEKLVEALKEIERNDLVYKCQSISSSTAKEEEAEGEDKKQQRQ